MTHEQVFDLLGVYALDALDATEAERVRSHVAGCPLCQVELAGFAEVTGQFVRLGPTRRPPATLRTRVLDAVEHQARRPLPAARRSASRSYLWIAGAALGVLLIASQVWLATEILSLRRTIEQQQLVQTILLSNTAFAFPMQPGDASLAIGGHYRGEPDLHMGVLNYYELPPPQVGQTYQCWFELADGSAISCGSLAVDARGQGLLLVTLPDPLPERMLVTLESAPVTRPTGPVVMVGPPDSK